MELIRYEHDRQVRSDRTLSSRVILQKGTLHWASQHEAVIIVESQVAALRELENQCGKSVPQFAYTPTPEDMIDLGSPDIRFCNFLEFDSEPQESRYRSSPVCIPHNFSLWIQNRCMVLVAQ